MRADKSIPTLILTPPKEASSDPPFTSFLFYSNKKV